MKFDKYFISGCMKMLIVNFSDIHYVDGFNNKILDDIYDSIRNIKPNFITVTGDIIDNTSVLDDNNVLYDFFCRLSGICSVLICLGNHDLFNPIECYSSIFKRLNNVDNIYVLDNSSIVFDDVAFSSITLGKDYYEGHSVDIDIDEYKFSYSKYNVLLIHNPIHIEYNIEKFNKFDLILAGHMHNGLVPHFIKGNFGIVGPSKTFFPRFARGYKKIDGIDVIVSGGITKLSNSAKLFHRFNFMFCEQIDIIYINDEKN